MVRRNGVLVRDDQDRAYHPVHNRWFDIRLGRRRSSSWTGKYFALSDSCISIAKVTQGLDNFHHGQAFSGFSEFAQTFLFAFFSYGGVELVALAAGESKSPHKSVPSAVRATFFRIIVFYVLAVLVIGLCINRNDPTLLSAAYGQCLCRFSQQVSQPAPDSDVAASPVTVVFVRAGFGAAAHVVNAVLLTAVLSATNSCFYASSRMLLSLARNGHAPSVFGWVNKRGVPVPALMYVAFILIYRKSLTCDSYLALPCSRPSSLSSLRSGPPASYSHGCSTWLVYRPS